MIWKNIWLDALAGGPARGPGAEGPGLPEHGVDEGGLAVIDVGDDGDVAQVLAHGHMELFFSSVREGAPEGAVDL